MKLSDADWQSIERQFQLGRAVSPEQGLAALLDLREQLAQQEDRSEFNIRLEALKAAREHLAGLPTEHPNQRGYADSALKPAERIAQELQVARFLLAQTRPEH